MRIPLSRMLRELASAMPVLVQLVRQYLILRYRRTMLGYVWTLINPLLMMSVTAVIFANLFKMELHNFAVFMFAGMVPWNFFASVVIQSSNSLIANEGLIRKIYLPKTLFPLSITLGILIDSVLSLIALFIIIFCIGGTPSWALLFLPVSYLLLFVFVLGVALFIALTTIFFRDMQQVLGIALQALFFLTPIIYEKTSLAGKLGGILQYNPIIPFIDLFRLPIYQGVMPELHTVVAAAVLGVLSLAIGTYIFLKHETKIVFCI